MNKITIILLMTLLTSACFQRTVIKPDSQTEKILMAVSGAIAESDVLSAIVQVDLVTIHGHHPMRAAIVMKKPSYLRLELLPVIGTPAFFLTATPEEMRIFIPSTGEFYLGKPTETNLTKFLPWQFNIDDIIRIYSGAYPLIKEEILSYKSYKETNSLRIEMKSFSDKTQILWVGENNRLLKLISLNEYDKEIYHINYEDYRMESPVPGKITINMADGTTSVSVKYTELKIEKITTPAIFDLEIPAGAKLILLE